MPQDPYFATLHTLNSSPYNSSSKHLSVHDHRSVVSFHSASGVSSNEGSGTPGTDSQQSTKPKGSFLKRAVKEILGGGGNHLKAEVEHPKAVGPKTKQVHAYGRGGAGRKFKKAPSPLDLKTTSTADRRIEVQTTPGKNRTEKWVVNTQPSTGPTESTSNSTFASTRGLLPGESELSFGNHGVRSRSPSCVSPSSSLPSSSAVPTPSDTPVHQRFNHGHANLGHSHSGLMQSAGDSFHPDARSRPGNHKPPHVYPHGQHSAFQDMHQEPPTMLEVQNPNFRYLTSGYATARRPSVLRSKPIRHMASHMGFHHPAFDVQHDGGCDDMQCCGHHYDDPDDYGVYCDEAQGNPFDGGRHGPSAFGWNNHDHAIYSQLPSPPPQAIRGVSVRTLPHVPSQHSTLRSNRPLPGQASSPVAPRSLHPMYPEVPQNPLTEKQALEAAWSRSSSIADRNINEGTPYSPTSSAPPTSPPPSIHHPGLPPYYTAKATPSLTLNAPAPFDHNTHMIGAAATYQSVVDHAQALQMQLQQSHDAERVALEEKLKLLEKEVKEREEKMSGLLWLMGEMGLEEVPTSAAELAVANGAKLEEKKSPRNVAGRS